MDLTMDAKLLLQKYTNHFNCANLLKEYVTKDFIEKQCNKLSDRMDKMKDMFWFTATEPNYLVYLFHCTRQYDEALELNKEIQAKWPDNIIAKIDRVGMAQEMAELGAAEMEIAWLKEYKDLEGFDHWHATAQAEMAFFIEDFGPKWYYRTMVDYEQALAPYIEKVDLLVGKDRLYEVIRKDDFDGKHYMTRTDLTWWFWNLAKLYSRILNKGNLDLFPEECRLSWVNSKQMARIIALLMYVIDAEEAMGSILLSTTAYTELANAYKKYEIVLQRCNEEKTQYLPDDMTVDGLMRKAVILSPEDAYVLEKVGRHFRQEAYDEDDLGEAIELLDKAVTINPLRDIAWHHLGLAYKALWVIQSDQPNKYAYQSFKRWTPKRGYGGNTKERGGRHHSRGRGNRLGQFYSGMAGESSRASYPPLTFFTVMKSSNPRECTTENIHPALTKAKECFEKASEIERNTSLCYLIDLARINISLQNSKDALICLRKALDLPSRNDSDKQTVYIQVALLFYSSGNELEITEQNRKLYADAREFIMDANYAAQVSRFTQEHILQRELEKLERQNDRLRLCENMTDLHNITVKFYDALRALERGLYLDSVTQTQHLLDKLYI